MLMAALLELLPNPDGFIKKDESAGDSRCYSFKGNIR